MPDHFRTSRRRRTFALAATACAAAAAMTAPSAPAAFTLGPCEGTTILGGGASFQAPVQNNLWRTTAYSSYCTQFGGVNSSGVNAYPTSGATSGSGAGRRIMGARTTGTGYDNASGSLSRAPLNGERYGGTDEPPSQQDVNQMNLGTDATGDEAQVRLIPVAVGALAVIVNTPDGCDMFNGAAAVENDPATPGLDETTLYSDANDVDRERVRFTEAILEDIWAGDGTYDTWGKVFGSNVDDADPGSGPTEAECRAKPIVRVVRFDDSGTTYVFKDYLGSIDPSEGWLTDYIDPDTRDWPNPDRLVGGVDTLQPAAANGNGAMRDKVRDTDGSIAYPELGTARGGTGNVFVRQDGADDRYWTQAQNGIGEFQDPAQQASSFKSSGGVSNVDKGARCSAITDLSGVPAGDDPTLDAGGWTAASMVNTTTPGQYGICSLTYILAWDDYADAYGSSETEQAKARTVKDYLKAILSTPGQQGSGAGTGTGLFGADQAPLSSEVRDLAVAGVNAIDWCKGGCGGTSNTDNGTTNTNTGNQTTNTPGPGPAPGPGPVPPPPPMVVVSNEFTVTSSRARANDILSALRLPGAGRVSVSARGRYKQTVRRNGKRRTRNRTVSIGSATVEVTRAGELSVRIPMSAAARKALGRIKRTARMAVTVTVTYTPTGGAPRTVTRTLNLRGRKK